MSVRFRWNWNLKLLVLRKGENRSTRGKISRSKGENQQQTQPTYGVDAGIRTQASFVGGGCSHHCATIASGPLLLPSKRNEAEQTGFRYEDLTDNYTFLGNCPPTPPLSQH